MAESVQDYIDRKMREVQNLIQEATEANALNNPTITDGYDPINGSTISITIRIHESKLYEYRQIKKN